MEKKTMEKKTMEKKTSNPKDNILKLFRRLLPEIPSTQMISDDGNFNEVGVTDFLNSVKFDKCDISYVVVAIMGPQSSGKSTLLNHLFHTKFKEMDALSGRSQTTRGVWIAKAQNMEPFTLVVDLEGTDGQERGEDDTAFEKQSALFALAVSDILLINIWCHDIGREHAANRPLLNTIFEVMIRLFSHRETTVLSPIKRKTTLFFVLRDHTKTPLEILERQLRNDMETIWKSVTKPEAFEGPLSEFFDVKVAGLPSYELQENEFEQKVAQLRELFSHSTSPGGIASGSRQGIVPASGFCFSAKEVWETIKHNQDLDLPAVKIMVASVRCENIAKDKLKSFESNQAWLDIQKAAKTKVVLGFGADISSILRDLLLEYDSEAQYFDEVVRNEKRQYLESEALKLVHPVYMMTLEHLRAEAFKTFENGLEKNLSEGVGFGESVRICRESCVIDFDRRCSDAAIKQAKWDASKVREELVRDIETQRLLVRTEKVPHVVDQCRERVSAKIGKRLKALFQMGDEKEVLEWAEVRKILVNESEAAALALSSALVAFELDEATLTQMVDEIKCYLRRLVERRFREEANDIVALLCQRFVVAWQEKECPNTDAKVGKGQEWAGYVKCLKLLSTLAVLRFDENYDDVENVLISVFMGPHDAGVLSDRLDSTTWEKVPAEVTLITPAECKIIWNQFVDDTKVQLAETHAVQTKSEELGIPAPPFWVILGLVVFGVHRFFHVLRVQAINLVALIGDLVQRGIIFIKEVINAVKECTDAVTEKIGEIMEQIKEAFHKFYDFMGDIVSKTAHAVVEYSTNVVVELGQGILGPGIIGKAGNSQDSLVCGDGNIFIGGTKIFLQ